MHAVREPRDRRHVVDEIFGVRAGHGAGIGEPPAVGADRIEPGEVFRRADDREVVLSEP